MPSEPLRPMAGERQPERPIHPGATIGHVHLKVADLSGPLPSTAACSALP